MVHVFKDVNLGINTAKNGHMLYKLTNIYLRFEAMTTLLFILLVRWFESTLDGQKSTQE